MNALSLFTGIGGIDLAAEWAGIKTVAMCEREPFCQSVLKKHWPGIPIYDDVCTLTKERLEQDGIGTIELIHGGYPCQPFSHAGNREGANDDRHLWPEVFRLIQAIQPKWFVGENVAGHITLGLDIVLSDLESIGYAWEAFALPAAAVGAPHRRERIFILAYANNGYKHENKEIRTGWNAVELRREILAYANSESRLQANSSISTIRSEWQSRNNVGWSGRTHQSGNDRWQVEPSVGRMVDGVSAGLDEYHESRLIALGNAVVPQQIYPILAAIVEIEKLIKS